MRAVHDYLLADAAQSKRLHPGDDYRRWLGLRLVTVAALNGWQGIDPQLYRHHHALQESARRAIKSLERAGLVETQWIWADRHWDEFGNDRDGYGEWHGHLHGYGIHCRLSADEWDRVSAENMSTLRTSE
jgi:hypothetical protein